MRVTIFDDDGRELASGFISDLKVDTRSRRVDIGATIMAMWRPLPEGGTSAKSVTDALMEHLVDSGKIEVSYSRQPPVSSIVATGLG